MKRTNQNQISKFREIARALESDEDESKFNDSLKRVAKAPPPKDEPKSGKREA
jgi:hypothetical protein